MPWKFALDAYVQGGLVGLSSRDYFVDGAFAFTRPDWRQRIAGTAQPASGPALTLAADF